MPKNQSPDHIKSSCTESPGTSKLIEHEIEEIVDAVYPDDLDNFMIEVIELLKSL